MIQASRSEHVKAEFFKNVEAEMDSRHDKIEELIDENDVDSTYKCMDEVLRAGGFEMFEFKGKWSQAARDKMQNLRQMYDAMESFFYRFQRCGKMSICLVHYALL